MRKYLVPILSLLIVSTILIVITFEPNNNVKILESKEVTEYNGENLSRLGDFRENSIKGPQYIDKESYRLSITGLVDNDISYNYEDVITKHQLYEKVVTLHCVEGWSVKILWEGVLVKDLLEEAGVNPEAKIVIIYAYDGYSTSLPIEFIVNNDILIAYKMNGVALPPERGFPFQLVAESKWGYKWIKWITEMELSDDVEFRGYWESRGYSNEGDLEKGFFS